MNSPTLGVLILNYNYARLVPRAIESVLSQSVAVDALVVVDDGSTDDSVAVIERYEPRIQFIRKDNGGQMTASRAGLAVLSTDYVYILDADDFVAADFSGEVRRHLHDRPVKLQFQLIGVDEAGEPTGSLFPSYPKTYGSEEMQRDNETLGFYLAPPTTGNVYSREFLSQLALECLGPNEPVDGPPSLAAPYYGAVVSLRKALAFYRSHQSGHSRWSAPTVTMLQHETRWFLQRWQEVDMLLGGRLIVAPKHLTVYVQERAVMIAGLQGKRPAWSNVRGFQQGVLRSQVIWPHRIFLWFWAAAFLLPSARLRSWLVFSRRSAASRPAWMKTTIGLVRAVVQGTARRSVGGSGNMTLGGVLLPRVSKE